MTLNKVCTEWIEKHQKNNVKRQSYVKYNEIINNYIIPYIGKYDIEKIKRRDIQDFVDILRTIKGKRTKRLLSAATINCTLTVLKLIFQYALDFEIIDVNPTDRIKGAKKEYNKRIKCFTIEEQSLIEKYCYSKLSSSCIGILLDLYTGLRIGELLALEWNDIDFVEGIIHITKTIYTSKNEDDEWIEMVDCPKTKTSYRDIPLPKFILDLLYDYKMQSNRTQHDRVFYLEKDESNLKTRTLRWKYDKMLDDLGIEHLSFHTLRHTFATRALESGMDVKTLADILGHANPTVTLMVYAHSLNEHKKAAMQLIKPIVEYNSNNVLHNML